MAKNNPRHATRVSQSDRSVIERWQNFLQTTLQGRLSRVAILPGTLLGVAACSLVIGLNGAGTDETKTEAQPLTAAFAPAADTPAADASQASTENENARVQPDTITENITKQAALPDSTAKETDEDSDGRYQVVLNLSQALENALNTNQQEDSSIQLLERQLLVQKGDTLSKLFNEVGLSSRTLYRLTNSGVEGKALAQVYPGQSLKFYLDQQNNLVQLEHIQSPLKTIAFNAIGDSFEASEIVRSPEIRTVQKSANVKHSLSLAAQQVGLSPSLTMNMANIFGGVMDFALDVRPNDHFIIIYEEHYLDGEKIDDGNVIAAQYTNAGKVFNAFRYDHENGEVGYYNEEGESMRKVFLRAPLDFTRVSSGFNLRRLHPISKKIKPHRGIDYAAPVGTPIFSVGDGRVSASGYSKANGNYIFIRHGDTYQTKYLHLKKRHVKKGQRIKQGQIIGSVGCTGLCTGPHLHYEFLVNGVHRNPRTIVSKLPKAKRLKQSELPGFLADTHSARNLLEHYGRQNVFALSE